MRKGLVIIFTLIIIVSFSEYIKIGVYGFEDNNYYNSIIESYLSRKDNVIVVDRRNIDLIIQEQKLELLGITEKTAGEFIGISNLDYLVICKEYDNSVFIEFVDKQGKIIYSNVLKGNIEKALKKELSSLVFIIDDNVIVKVRDVIDDFQNTKYLSFKGTISFFEPYIGLDMGYYIYDSIAIGLSGELNVIGYPLSRWNVEGYVKYNVNNIYSKFGLGYHNDIYNIANTIYYLTINPGYELNNFSIELPLKVGYNLGKLILDPGLNLFIGIKF
ncbi:hypothetical protein [Marinitoga litoralis]|uniref:hypothetical protein n=1 Tax=Marinitoga litoralis TaxID=570855 RepID=UPI00195F3A08|nr:hypothetical protein [Marinitoga litoralis]MBM7560373.1 hypothetical protein [Marinitoga litoralis]